jgi:chromosome segregation ATPase
MIIFKLSILVLVVVSILKLENKDVPKRSKLCNSTINELQKQFKNQLNETVQAENKHIKRENDLQIEIKKLEQKKSNSEKKNKIMEETIETLSSKMRKLKRKIKKMNCYLLNWKNKLDTKIIFSLQFRVKILKSKLLKLKENIKRKAIMEQTKKGKEFEKKLERFQREINFINFLLIYFSIVIFFVYWTE